MPEPSCAAAPTFEKSSAVQITKAGKHQVPKYAGSPRDHSISQMTSLYYDPNGFVLGLLYYRAFFYSVMPPPSPIPTTPNT